jgi:hypothetical protein
MLSSADRKVVTNLFRPSLVAWRAKYLAEKVAQAKTPADTATSPPGQLRKPTR